MINGVKSGTNLFLHRCKLRLPGEYDQASSVFGILGNEAFKVIIHSFMKQLQPAIEMAFFQRLDAVEFLVRLHRIAFIGITPQQEKLPK